MDDVLDLCNFDQQAEANFTYRQLIGLALTHGAICKQYNGDLKFYTGLIDNLSCRGVIDFGLSKAPENGSRDIIDLMIKKGAQTLNLELTQACHLNKPDMCQWLIEGGATECVECDGTKHKF